MIAETSKIMGEAIPVVPTTVRVPVRVSHSEAIYARFRRPADPDAARQILSAAPGVVVIDTPAENSYPLALDAEGRDEVFVGRIRAVPGDERALVMWVVADNLRQGAATHAVQIGEVWAAAMRGSELRYA